MSPVADRVFQSYRQTSGKREESPLPSRDGIALNSKGAKEGRSRGSHSNGRERRGERPASGRRSLGPRGGGRPRVIPGVGGRSGLFATENGHKGPRRDFSKALRAFKGCSPREPPGESDGRTVCRSLPNGLFRFLLTVGTIDASWRMSFFMVIQEMVNSTEEDTWSVQPWQWQTTQS